jgi:hypothetical protein
MGTRKVFAREKRDRTIPKPKCRACFNINAIDHNPGETCVVMDWSKREYAQRKQSVSRTTPESKGK